MNPQLGDIKSQQKFEPGDRLLVRAGNCDPAQRQKIITAVKKHVGEDVRVLVYNGLAVRLGVYNEVTGQVEWWAGNEGQIAGGLAVLHCSTIRLRLGDTVYYEFLAPVTVMQVKQFQGRLRDWVDGACEIFEWVSE